jgi:metal-dependent amidase/aminoacylase/carboxypeptidase family protein
MMMMTDTTVTAADIEVGWHVNSDTSWDRIVVEWVRRSSTVTYFAGCIARTGHPVTKAWDSSSPIIAHH